jgi:hypothetical protein
LLRRIRILTGLFILGLVLSGVTAIPLRWEVDLLSDWFGKGDVRMDEDVSAAGLWLEKVRLALTASEQEHPFLYYGTDWLAFGHLMIAIAFVGAWRDPVRNRWLFDFGLITCALVIPWALIFGAVRGIPLWWRLVDCTFGILGAVPLLLCRVWVDRIRGTCR